MKELVVATKNEHKILEFKRMLEPIGYKLTTLFDYPDIPDIIEDGNSFRENALIKAKTLSDILHKDVIADDSGLEVKALHNEPGIYSARYAGEDVDYHANNELLLHNMIGKEDRAARFVTTICLYRIAKEPQYFEGYLHGEIAQKYKGEHGFGYDPIFILPNGKHLAELPLSDKNQISHRGKSLQKLIEYLKTDH